MDTLKNHIDDLQSWVGRKREAHDSMSPEVMLRYQVTLDQTPPSLVAEDQVPPCAHWFYFTPLDPMEVLAKDGHARKGDFLPPVPLDRRMWAGGVVRLLAPMHTGTPATRTSTIANIEAKSGRSGPLCFVTVQHLVKSEGTLCIEEEQHIVFREAQASGEAPVRKLPFNDKPEWTNEWTPTSVQLFRFSAITFNSHRIHYDADYTRKSEGYPDLVVHGPLILHKILESFRNRHPDREIRHIQYRAVGPVYCGETVTLAGKDTLSDSSSEVDTDGQSHCVVFGPEGCLAMQADLIWRQKP